MFAVLRCAGQTGNLGLLDTFFYLVSRAKKCTLICPYIGCATKTCMFGSGKSSPKGLSRIRL